MGKANGFTLVEVLVTSAITSVVILSLMGAFRTAQVADYQHRCAVENAQSLRLAASRLTDEVRLAKTIDSPTTQKLILQRESPPEEVTYLIVDGQFKRSVSSDLYSLVSGVASDQSYLTKNGELVSVHLVLATPTDARCGTKPLGPDATLDLNIALYSKQS